MGYYISNIDLILIRRDKDYEQVNGKIFTEGQLVHELTHATSGFRKYVADEDGFNYNPRVGFALTYTQFPWGWFFEEVTCSFNNISHAAFHERMPEYAKKSGYSVLF